MTMRGIHYLSMFDASGYGIAGMLMVRALANAGIPVKWTPLQWHASDGPPQRHGYRSAMDSAFMQDSCTQTALFDLPHLARLIDSTADYDVVIMHTIPEYWPVLSEPGCRNIGHTVWETTRLPLHWVQLFNNVDDVILPCRFNVQTTRASGCNVPVHVLPHIRRHQWRDFRLAELDGLRSAWGIAASKFVFYSINVWDIRKNLALLVRAFAHAFSSADPVQLLIKTSELAHLDQAPYTTVRAVDFIPGLLDAIRRETGRELPGIRFIVDNKLPADQIDAIHELGDCFVSFTHGEGWGLGAFDAATYGNPVVMPSWGGVLDYLPELRIGAVPFVPAQTPIWPPHKPSYWSDQSWVDVSLADAVTVLRRAFTDQHHMRDEALAIQASIADGFAESRVVATLLEALGS